MSELTTNNLTTNTKSNLQSKKTKNLNPAKEATTKKSETDTLVLQGKSSEKFSDKQIKPPAKGPEFALLKFGNAIKGNTTKEIERNIRYKRSGLKEVSGENYETVLKYLKLISQEMENQVIKAPFKESAIEYGMEKIIDSIIENKLSDEESLKQLVESLKTQKDLGIQLSLKPDFLLESPRGKTLVKDFIKNLEDAGVTFKQQHYDFLKDRVASMKKEITLAYPELLKTDEARNKGAISHINLRLKEISNLLIYLEKIKPEINQHTKDWFKKTNSKDFTEQSNLLKTYIGGLALHGATELDDALASFCQCKVKPSKSMVDNLIKLRAYGGLMRPSRLKPENYDENKFENLLSELVKNFEDKNHNSDRKVGVILFTGVIEEDGEDIFSDSGSAHNSIIRMMGDKVEEGYGNLKVLVYEGDTHHLLLAVNNSEKITGKKTSFALQQAHGTGSLGKGNGDGRGLHLGDSQRETLFVKPNLDAVDKTLDYPKVKPIQKWVTRNLATGITYNEAYLDYTDKDIMAKCKNGFTEDASMVFFSCASANEDSGEPSVARVFNEATGVKTYACIKNITTMSRLFFNKDGLKSMQYATPSYQVLPPTIFDK